MMRRWLFPDFALLLLIGRLGRQPCRSYEFGIRVGTSSMSVVCFSLSRPRNHALKNCVLEGLFNFNTNLTFICPFRSRGRVFWTNSRFANVI